MEDEVEHPVQAVLDAPMGSGGVRERTNSILSTYTQSRYCSARDRSRAQQKVRHVAEGLGVVVAAIKHVRDVHDPTFVTGAYRALLKVDDDTRSDAARWTA